MQPYQKSSLESQRQGKAPLKTALTVGSIALSAATPSIVTKAKALLSAHIPSGLALKGLNHLDSRYGNFANSAINHGASEDEAVGFIKEKIESGEKSLSNSLDQKNVIQQYDDKLHAFIESEIKKGRNPLEAGAIARTNGQFEKSIRKLEKDHKTNWSSILESVYGMGEQSQQQPQQMQQQNQTGNVDDTLMAAFDKILKM